MARKVKTRQQDSPIPTIIGIGITEQWYFTHLQRIFGYRVKVRPRFFGQEDIFQLTKKVESVIQDGGIAIAVFDADVASWNEKERKKLDDFRKKYDKHKNVIICDSLPSIEYWFMLHLRTYTDYFPHHTPYVRSLRNSLTAMTKLKIISAVKSGCANFANLVVWRLLWNVLERVSRINHTQICH